ncbi:putative ATPase [Kribbella orskensis]|uniref:ATPase n=1 Tax=Kribbella orskensis TaxID=2512216 RepID=A0ABY2BUP2_9ACTN|nr:MULTISPECIES: LuxR C-terminal-related transcriptional regulator [Kribbella]TCN44211.1 putative ATPase [Kribbella sp. VKM Ac-2500]TCO32011.1 putative ATPase [Kribbella orskensis]
MAESRPAAVRGRLPAELTSFVGRRRALADTRRLLSSSRLLTLTGVGGVGKTRLALRMAAEVRRTFGDGVWFVELAALRDPALLGLTLAQRLELSRVSANPTADLAEYLEDRHLLLVLDNCEQVAEACAVLVSKLLAAAPQLRILATSRHVLGVEGEQVLSVPPLSTPPVEAPVADAGQYESVVLFADRVRAVLPEFVIGETNRAQVIEVCRRLDGVPLALELAAVWMRTLSLSQILDRLEDRFRLLATGRQARPARQRALDAAVGWSYDLCSPAERMLWDRLSVFAGGFDLEGAEEVCSGDGIPCDAVLNLVAGLVDKSIITRMMGTAHTAAWYDMLTTIGQYGGLRLAEAGQTREFRFRHRDYYRSLAARWEAESFGPRQADWYLQLRREHDNLRAALDFCLAEPGEGPAALEIAAPIWMFWFAGFLREGHRYLSRAIDAAPEQTPTRAKGLWAGSYLASFLDEAEQATRLLTEYEELAERYDDDHMRARIAELSGHMLILQGDLVGAVAQLERGLVGHRAVGDVQGEFDVLILLSAATFFLGDPRVEDFGRQAYELTESRGADSAKGYALWTIGLVQWRDHNQFDKATLSLRESIRLWQPVNDRTGMGFSVQALSWCAGSDAPDERAARLMGASRAVWRSNGAYVVGMTPYSQFDDQTEQRIRSTVGDEVFDAAFAQGAAYSFEQAVALALGEETERDGAAKPGMAGRLTRRELEIAGLVGEGLSNREIAARLVISQRTAETHVEHILTKLGFSSRAQIARWVTDHLER